MSRIDADESEHEQPAGKSAQHDTMLRVPTITSDSAENIKAG